MHKGSGATPYREDMDDPGIRVAEDTVIPLDEVQFRASRSSGPGGQHANVTASRIEAVFDVESSQALSERQRELLLRRLGPQVTAVAQDARGQARNRELALERLRARLTHALDVPRARRKTKPTAASKARRVESKRRLSQRKRARRRPAHDD
jgi:ribosome-associated protein